MPLDETNPEFAKATKQVNDALYFLMQAIAAKELLMRDLLYQEAFDEGVAWAKGEFDRIINTNNTEVETETVKHSIELTQIEKLAKDNILQTINTGNGTVRTSDLVTKITALPVKPSIDENMVKVLINALTKEGKIRQKQNRWYSTDSKNKLPDYQVMTYLPDGSKYLGSDITR